MDFSEFGLRTKNVPVTNEASGNIEYLTLSQAFIDDDDDYPTSSFVGVPEFAITE